MVKKVVFDVDDILWGLNERATERAGVDYKKLVVYDCKKNDVLSSEERSKMLEQYGSLELFEGIEWYDGIDKLVNLERAGYELYINSNSYTKEVADMKLKQLSSVLPLPPERFIMNVRLSCDTPKGIEDDVLFFVDDSPYNLVNSNAKHNLTISKPWNYSEWGISALAGKDVVRFSSLLEVLDYILQFKEVQL